MSTEKLLNLIRGYSSQGQFDQLSELISNTHESLKNANYVDEIIHNLEIQEHSAAILCLLLCKMNISTVNFSQLFGQINEFITDCNDEQIKQVSHLFASLCHKFTDRLIDSKQYLQGLDPLCRAIVKVQQSPSQLTSIHTDLCKLALLAKCVKPAVQFLNIDIVDINKENDTYDVKYYLSYLFYGGIIYCILNNFERAFFFFQSAISTSGSAVSQIVIESYKKYILVSLLIYGKIQPLTKNTTAQLNRSVKPFCNAYHDLANAYANNSIEELNKSVHRYGDIFSNDTNMGLVKQVVASLVKVKMQKLTKTFMTLPLKDMASKVQLNNVREAETKILQMIEDEEIFASINQRNGMVTFSENPEKYNSLQMYRKIENELNKCINLNDKLKQLDQEIALNPKFIQKIRNELE